MDFNKTSDKSGLIQLCESLCLLGDTGISSNSTLLAQFTNYLNMSLSEVWGEIVKSNKTAKADDMNWSDVPDAPISLVALQADYTLPVSATGANSNTLQAINGVYHTKNGYRTYLRPMENNETLLADDGVPTAYRIQGKSIFLDVQPSSTFVTDVTYLHIEFQRVPYYFVSGDTTRQAGFMAIHHPLLAIKASSWYLKPINPQLSRQYSSGRDDAPGDFETGLRKLKSDYANLDDSVEHNITSEYIRFR